ncbi:MAG: hypothetical protein IPG11_11875 [Flavobacteriales bacterium]|nr:hypothetical protein [Flavobacteriales bacterium]
MFARYLRTSAIFFAPILLILVGIEVGLRRIPNDYSFKHEQLVRNGSEFQILVLGNSHAYKGIDPEVIGLPGFNAANISQDLSYDRAVLERHLPYLPSLDYIILPISYGTLGSHMASGKESWRVKNYTIYMGIDKDANELADHLELLIRPMQDQLSMLSKYYLKGRDNRSCQQSGVASQMRRTGVDLSSTGRKAAARHFHPSNPATEQSLKDLDAIIALASQHSIEVVLVTLPAWSSYRRELDPVQLERKNATCERLANNSPAVHYFDLLDDPRFDSTNFEDADHLSFSGSVKVSKLIAILISGLPKNDNRNNEELHLELEPSPSE